MYFKRINKGRHILSYLPPLHNLEKVAKYCEFRDNKNILHTKF